jgi:hypothetical protein
MKNMSTVWGIHGGRTGDADSLFLQKNYIALGWNRTGDLSKLSATRDAFKANIKANYPNHKPGAIPVDAGQLIRFVHHAKIGDLVGYFSKRDRLIHIGRITGDYVYRPDEDASYPHLRSIEWLQHYPRTYFTQSAMYELFASMSFFKIDRHDAEFRKAAEGKAELLPIEKPVEETKKSTAGSHNANIFVSYRRNSWPFTHRLVDDLRERIVGEIFIDLTGIDDTNFERSILKHLKASNTVLVVCSENAFAPERIQREEDWLRREVKMALELGKQIVLINVNGSNLPETVDLPGDIQELPQRQAINFYPEYWDGAVERLVQFISVVASAPAKPMPEKKKSLNSNSTLRAAMEALDEGDYDKAIFLLNELRETGFHSRAVNIDEVLQHAIGLQDNEARRREAQSEYDIIAALASSRAMLPKAQAAWAKFQEQYSDFDGDVENLAEQLKGALKQSRAVVTPTEEPVRELAERQYQRRDFWTGLLAKSKGRTHLFERRKPSTDHWLAIGAGRSGITYNYYVLKDNVGIGLYIDTGDRDRNKTAFDELDRHRSAIEKKFGEALNWQRLDAKRACRISIQFDRLGGLSNPENWDQIQDTMIDLMIRFDQAMKPHIEAL